MGTPILVDAEDLITAIEERDAEVEWFLDLSSGQVVPLVSETVCGDAPCAEAIEAEPDRYLPIEPIDSYEAFSIMEGFVESLPEGEPASQLAEALSRPRPFRRFKDALLGSPFVREMWFRYHDAHMREIAQAWLIEQGLNARLTDATRSRSDA